MQRYIKMFVNVGEGVNLCESFYFFHPEFELTKLIALLV
jgi:hypothetical protein